MGHGPWVEGVRSYSSNEVPVYSVKEAARELRVSPSLIYALVARGQIECERYGVGRGTIRISGAALADYRRRSRVTSTPATVEKLSPGRYRELDPTRLARAWILRGAISPDASGSHDTDGTA